MILGIAYYVIAMDVTIELKKLRKSKKVRILENYNKREGGFIALDLNPEAKEGAISNVTTIKGRDDTQW